MVKNKGFTMVFKKTGGGHLILVPIPPNAYGDKTIGVRLNKIIIQYE